MLFDLHAAVIDELLRATLLMLGKLMREHTVDADDMRAVLGAGASRQQIEDALVVEAQSLGSGLGIGGMRERVQQFQGEMEIQSDASGTKIRVNVPVVEIVEEGRTEKPQETAA